MPSQTEKDHFFNPRNAGEICEPTVRGRSGSVICGAVLAISLRIDDEQRIAAAGFQSAGCSRLVAASSLLTDRVTGMTTAEAASWARSAHQYLGQELGPVDAGREHCANLPGIALLTAIRSFSDSVRAEWSGEEALICTCFGVAERTIESEIQSKGLTTIEEVTVACNAGGGCRSCYSLIQDILDQRIHEG